MPVSPLENAEGPVRVLVSSNGNALPDWAPLSSVTVHHAVNTAPVATLVFTDGDPLSSGFPLFDLADLQPGAELTVKAGYGYSEAAIFSGIVVTHGLRISGDNQVRLVIACRGTVSAAAPSVDKAGALAVNYGESLIALEAELDPRRPLGVGQSPPFGESLPGLRGRMRFPGSALAVVGGLIELNGVGARFGGAVRAAGVTHEIDQGGWTTEVAFGTPAEESMTLADGHGNSIRLDATGITMESARDVTIDAKGTTTVSAAGLTTVKGAMVMIN